MDPTLIAGGVGVGAQVLSGIIGQLISQGDRDRAFALLQQAAQAGNVPLPDLQKIAAEQLGPSAMESLQTDPNLRSAQISALDRLQQIGDEGGMLLSDKANLNRIDQQVAREAASRNQGITDDMQARGVGGSGAEFAMRQAANQATDQRLADTGMDVAAQAQQRALDAIMQRGQMAGQVRGQDFGEQSQVAQAKDLISRYNADSRSKANYYNAGLSQQDYENRLGRADRQAQNYRDQANYYQGEANRKANIAGSTGNAVAYGAGAYINSRNRGGNRDPSENEDPNSKYY
jgi:hypothetical protein